MTVVPGQKGTAGVEEVPDPDARHALLLVRGMALGVCGPDHEIAQGAYGTPLANLRAAERPPEDIKVVVDLTA